MKKITNTGVKNLINCICFVTVILALAILLGKILEPHLPDTDKIESFHDMPENNFDVIGYGSSHVFAAMNPRLMRDEYGISAYNYGAEWQNMDTTELFIRDSLLTQSPKLAIIEAYYAFNFPDVQYLDAEMLYTKAINADKRDYLYSRFGMDLTGYASYYLPILAYHDLWSGISRDSFSYVSRYDEFTESLGQIVVENVEPITVPSYAELPQDGMTEEAAERLDGMVELCEQNGMDVLFIITPMHEAYPYTDAIGEYADSRECGYINFYKIMDDIGLDPATDYYDEAHINLNGSEKISRYLSEYILEHYIP